MERKCYVKPEMEILELCLDFQLLVGSTPSVKGVSRPNGYVETSDFNKITDFTQESEDGLKHSSIFD